MKFKSYPKIHRLGKEEVEEILAGPVDIQEKVDGANVSMWWDEDEQHIRNIREYLKKRKILCFSVVDEGVNETESHVLTALATEVLDKDDAEVQKVMSTFKLYRDPIKVTMEIDR